MLRRALILEALWLKTIHAISQSTYAPATATLTRAAAHMHKDLMTTQGAIYKIQLDHRAGFTPIRLSQDMALADDPRAIDHSKGKHGLTTKQVVLAEMEADEIFDTEFRAKAKPPVTLENLPTHSATDGLDDDADSGESI